MEEAFTPHHVDVGDEGWLQINSRGLKPPTRGSEPPAALSLEADSEGSRHPGSWTTEEPVCFLSHPFHTHLRKEPVWQPRRVALAGGGDPGQLPVSADGRSTNELTETHALRKQNSWKGRTGQDQRNIVHVATGLQGPPRRLVNSSGQIPPGPKPRAAPH